MIHASKPVPDNEKAALENKFTLDVWQKGSDYSRLLPISFVHELEKEMATHSSILAWRIAWREENSKATVHGVTKSWTLLSD